MALKPCRECGHEVSTDAKICPHCGVRSPTASGGLKNAPLGIFIILFVIAVWVIATSKPPRNSAGRNATPKASRQFYRQLYVEPFPAGLAGHQTSRVIWHRDDKRHQYRQAPAKFET